MAGYLARLMSHGMYSMYKIHNITSGAISIRIIILKTVEPRVVDVEK